MTPSEACEAISSERRIRIRYSAAERIVEVHTVGFSRDEQPIMRAWQVRGGRSGSDQTGWKLFRLNDVEFATKLDEKSEAPRLGYKRGDPAISRIICEL